MSSGLTALNIQEAGNADRPEKFWEKDLFGKDIHKTKVSKKLLLNMLNQMSLMMRAGVSLIMAMDVMIDSQKDKTFKRILQEMRQDLLGGRTITESMTKFRAFPEMVVSMVRSGEENGRLDEAFQRCAALQESSMTLSSKLRSAMIYPCILLVLTLVLIIVMNTLVLPSFTGIFKQMGAQLPALTLGVMAVSDFIIHKWPILVGAAVVIIGGYQAARRFSPDFVEKSDSFKLRFPIIGEVLRLSLLSRFSRVMASLVDAGVDVVSSLEIAGRVVANRRLEKDVGQIIEDVKVGVAINASMARFPVFDSLFVSMVKAGEETGMLGDSLGKMAELYDQRANESTKRMTTLLEPLMTVIIALVVGTVIISIAMPMFGLYNVVSKG